MAGDSAQGGSGQAPAGTSETPAGSRTAGPSLPWWVPPVGRSAWLLVGIAILAAIVLLVLGLISDLLIPLTFAAILGAVFVPLVDRFERWHIRRSLGAPLVVLLVLATVMVVVWMVFTQIIGQGSEIIDKVTAGIDSAGDGVSLSQEDKQQAAKIAGQLVLVMIEGTLKGLGSVTVLIVALVVGVFFMFFLMKEWTHYLDGTSRWLTRVFALPPGVGSHVLSDAVQSFRGYAWGMTIIGFMNATVVGLGALLLGVPLAGPIAIVTFVTSYIPFFGAFFSGAFAVLIALGSQGIGTAVAMLAIVLLSQNTLQNLLQPFAFGRALSLHPMVIMLVSTGGALLFGVLGATLAPPLTAVALRASRILREAGVFEKPPVSWVTDAVAGGPARPPPSAPPLPPPADIIAPLPDPGEP
jgi:predicted PurR-regulated permease PerM